MTNSTISELTWKNVVRVAAGWWTAGWVLFRPLPYDIPWWGRFLVAFTVISIAHSTAGGFVLRNFAASGPRIFGMFRGMGVADRRNGVSTQDAEGATTVIRAPKRRKSDANSSV